jgi:hypothetical protein
VFSPVIYNFDIERVQCAENERLLLKITALFVGCILRNRALVLELARSITLCVGEGDTLLL